MRFSLNTGSGWQDLGAAERSPGGWRIGNLTLPTHGQLRALGRTANGTSHPGLIEQTIILEAPVVAWREHAFGANAQNAAIAGDDADADADGLSNLAEYSGGSDPLNAGSTPSLFMSAGLAGWLTVLFTTIGGLLFGLGFIFPTGRGHTPAWDRVVRLGAVAFPFILVVGFLIRPGPLQLFPTIDNPFGVGPDFRPVFGSQVSLIVAATSGAFVPFLGLSIASRYRMSDTVGRKQLKWFVLALLASLGGIAVAALGALISEKPPEAGLAVFGYAGALVPVAIGIAILRHNLYDIDRLISRTLSYAAITAVLAGVFSLAALSLGIVLGSLAEGQTIAVAGSTLFVAALFGPLRRRAQTIVDRRFDRSSYDASLTVQAMSTRLRDDVDLDRVEADVLGVVDRTFHPVQAGVWLRRASR